MRVGNMASCRVVVYISWTGRSGSKTVELENNLQC